MSPKRRRGGSADVPIVANGVGLAAGQGEGLPTVPHSFHQTQMPPRLDNDRLIGMALAAIEDVAARCRHAPQPRTRSLAMVLAYLASRRIDHANREPFDVYWRALTTAYSVTRAAMVNSAVNGIYLALGLRRPSTTAFESAAQRALGEVARPHG